MRLEIFILFIFSICFCQAILVSPEEISFEGPAKEMLCEQVNIESSGSVLVQDRWAEKGFTERELKSHHNTAENLDIEIYYASETPLEKMEVCFKAQDKGIYHGVLLFRESNQNSGVGVWISANITKSTGVIGKLTGAVIGDAGNFSPVFALGTSSFILLGGLLAIILLKKHPNNNHKYP